MYRCLTDDCDHPLGQDGDYGSVVGFAGVNVVTASAGPDGPITTLVCPTCGATRSFTQAVGRPFVTMGGETVVLPGRPVEVETR